MATVQEIYNEIDRIDNAKSGIAGAIEEKGVEVPAGAKIDEYPELVRQIQQGDTSDCVKFTPQTLTEEQKAQARENIGAGGGGDGKMGVISQTQTWSGSGSNPRTYVMSNPVTGLIPQANIDLFEAAGATFNAVTGYFELNGLTDISYEEMKNIYTFSIRSNDNIAGGFTSLVKVRTTLTISRATGTLNTSFAFANGCAFETFAFSAITGTFTITPYGNWFVNCLYLRKVTPILSITRYQETLFQNCYSLVDVQIKGLAVNFAAKNSPALSTTSLAYMINNAGTATITITLHATAYARAIADASVQAALQSKTNVSLASA